MDKTRDRRIDIIRRRLLQKSIPRIQVSMILSLTALAGFLTSFSLLHLGVPQMWLRYPLAISIAYCVFLLLLALWLWLHRGNLDPDPDSPVLDFIPYGPSEHAEASQFGGGADFGGGGAGGSWGEGAPTSSAGGSSGGSGSGIGLDLDLEEGWLVVVAIVALVGGLIASFYVIYIAPALLAEILVDGALAAGLYRRVRNVEQRHWLRGAVRQTLLPAFLVALCFTVAGYALQKAVPEANTIGDVWNHATRR